MTWFKVDDSFHSHPKTTATSLAALGLWTVAGAWSGDHLTDGFVPDHAISLLSRGATELADELVVAGLWKRIRGGYRFHDWERYQPTKESVLKERKAAAERQRRRRSVTGEVTPVSRRDSRGSHGEVRVGGTTRSSAERSVGGQVSSPPRDDVERLCRHLAERVEGNGSKRPTVGKAWRDAARLLMDSDGRDEQDVHRAIDWCQDHHFWRSNVMSMPKLREQYDKLRLQAQAERSKPTNGYHSPTDANIEAFLGVDTPLRALPGGGW